MNADPASVRDDVRELPGDLVAKVLELHDRGFSAIGCARRLHTRIFDVISILKEHCREHPHGRREGGTT